MIDEQFLFGQCIYNEIAEIHLNFYGLLRTEDYLIIISHNLWSARACTCRWHAYAVSFL